MPISIAGSGTITGISAGGLPDDCITTAEIAANAVTTAKLGTAEASGLCKAWVNFNGTGTVAIRASYNVSSITDNGVGSFTVNFTTAMPDANYSVSGNTNWSGGPWIVGFDTSSTRTSSALPIVTGTTPGVAADTSLVNINVFR
jgi:hypothetical protein